jgi:hypothetical protein
VITLIDESENIYVYKTDADKALVHHSKIKEAKDFPKELASKDLFGMGYPYLTKMYGHKVTFSTDYGVVLMDLEAGINLN